ncbi:MAG: CBS domain-containing protein [Micromonosporaceae bacterium]|nr:CBS domain-containing protein [Micromonosporaceae bacterium]
MRRWYVSDVMTRDVATVTGGTGYKEIADLLVHRSVSAVPVVDEDRHVLGVVSEADLLAKLEYADRMPRHPLALRRARAGRRKASGDTAAELMSAPPVVIGTGATVAQAARLMDAARVKRLPVVDEQEHLVGVVARRDLVRLYTRTDEQIRVTVVTNLVTGLWLEPEAVQVSVRAGVVTLRGRMDRRTTAAIAVNFTVATPGVVDVVDELSWDVDDGELARSHRHGAVHH